MKIFKFICTAAVFASVLFVSCEKNTDDTKKQDPVPYETPEFAEVATKVTFADDAAPKTNGGEIIKSIEFTESGYAIILKEKVKADDGTNAIVTTFTYEAGIYKILGFGNVEIKGAKVTITQVAGNTGEDTPSDNYEGNANVSTGTGSNDMKDYFCAWEIMTTKIKVDGPNYGFDKLFNDPAVASDLFKIAQYVNEKKKVIDEKEFEGYKVESISLTEAGTIMVKFVNGVSYVGVIPEGLKSKKFTYELDIESNFMFSAKADGSIDLDKDTNILTFVVTGDFKYNNDTYTSEVKLTLKQKADVQ